MSSIIIIPARIGSTRLEKKMLLQINGKELILRVYESCNNADIGPVFVATDSQEIADVIGKNCIFTDSNLQSGTDRVFEAYKKINMNVDNVINVQGDLPFLKPESIKKVNELIKKPDVDIATLIVEIDKSEAMKDSNVKVVVDTNNRAMYFSRSCIPYNAQTFLYHVGIYGYKTQVLEKFVNLPYSLLEASERLEQLRAMEHGFNIYTTLCQEVPISIDTHEDFEKAKLFSKKSFKYENIR